MDQLFIQVEIDKIANSYLKDDYIRNIYDELNKVDNTEWVTIGVKSVLQYSFQMLICLLNNYIIETGIYVNKFVLKQIRF